MTVHELKQQIKQNNVPNFLIFTGDEYYVQKMYIQQIAKVKGLDISYIDSITDVWGSLSTKSLLSVNYLYVVRDDKELITNEKIYSRLADVLKDDVLIMLVTSIDNRLKIYKQYKDSIVMFEPLNEVVLTKYIQQQVALTKANCNKLMKICEYNYGRCLLEIDKIKRATGELNPDVTFTLMLENGTIYVPPEDTLWDFIKAFLKDQPKVAYERYRALKGLETSTFMILTNLYNSARAVYQIQTCASTDVTKSTGLSSWQIRNAKECANRFSSDDIEYLMRLIQKAEVYIKSGKLDESIAIDWIFTSFF